MLATYREQVEQSTPGRFEGEGICPYGEHDYCKINIDEPAVRAEVVRRGL